MLISQYQQCIRQWRDPTGKPYDVVDSGNTKKCPMCRSPSKFITPSSKFFAHGSTLKDRAIAQYMESMARVPCKYFQHSLRKAQGELRRRSAGATDIREQDLEPFCPFGKDCFYQHLNEDGSVFVFENGVDKNMKVCMVCSYVFLLTLRCSTSHPFFLDHKLHTLDSTRSHYTASCVYSTCPYFEHLYPTLRYSLHAPILRTRYATTLLHMTN